MEIRKDMEEVHWKLRVIASQNKKNEMPEEQLANACFETGYERIIDDAREALTTLDRILNQDEAELVKTLAAIIDNCLEEAADPHDIAEVILRALGLMDKI